jgi:DNA topoisomerase-1
VRDETKYARLIQFGRALPGIRRRVQRDLAPAGLPREKVLATVVRLLETTLIRVGNEEYARENRSYGLTTLRTKHVRGQGSAAPLRVPGKGGKPHLVDVSDRRLARIVQQCQELPGHELFQYVDESGERQAIDSSDINAYLRDIAGHDFTAKDFRTWAGTVLAATTLQAMTLNGEQPTKKRVTEAVATVAERLRNTPAICRKCYIHPAVLTSFLESTLGPPLTVAGPARPSSRPALRPEERAVLKASQARCRARRTSPRRHPLSRTCSPNAPGVTARGGWFRTYSSRSSERCSKPWRVIAAAESAPAPASSVSEHLPERLMHLVRRHRLHEMLIESRDPAPLALDGLVPTRHGDERNRLAQHAAQRLASDQPSTIGA